MLSKDLTVPVSTYPSKEKHVLNVSLGKMC